MYSKTLILCALVAAATAAYLPVDNFSLLDGKGTLLDRLHEIADKVKTDLGSKADEVREKIEEVATDLEGKISGAVGKVAADREKIHQQVEDGLKHLKDVAEGVASGVIEKNSDVARKTIEELKKHRGILGDAFGDLVEKIRGLGASKDDKKN